MTVKAAAKVFTIGASAPFADTLARGLIARLGDDGLALAGVTIHLPTRRAARNFGDIFASLLDGAALLPQFRALGDADEDDLLFDADSDLEQTPAIPPLRRQMLLAHLVRRWHRQQRGDIGFAQAAALAAQLAGVMDEMETQGADPALLADLAPLELAEHWRDVHGFLAILYDTWPAVLAAEGVRNPAARRSAAIRALAKRLEASPPQDMVIAAGSTGSIPATAELLSVIARLPNGAVVLPGLDRHLDDDAWDGLDPGHPQYGLKQLLQRLEVARADVADWDGPSPNPGREHLISETLRPAPTTHAWRALVEQGGGGIADGLGGIATLTASDTAEEALAIALALREALETTDRTAALVTPDRNLGRRVAAELKRWNIAIDDSAGRPLAHTSAGAFLCLVAEAAAAQFAPVPLLALLKHPFARRGEEPAPFRAKARMLDKALRGPRPDAGLEGVTRRLAEAPEDIRTWWSQIADLLSPLQDAFTAQETALSDLLTAHLAAAEKLACGSADDCILWADADGRAAASFVAALQDGAAGQPPIEPDSYAPLFRRLALQQPVRGEFGQHPRLAILGPLEARLQRFDFTILGGLNEGAWPRSAAADPWFSRPMRRTLGLEQPERAIGLSAHDFAMLAAGPQVLLTRALKAEGSPTVASRWLQRLEQLTQGLGLQAALEPPPPQDFARLAALLRDVKQEERLKRPAPTPPVSARPRGLSVTDIETWLRDPYAIYARRILKLKKLEPLNDIIGPLTRGNALHLALELFIGKYPDALPDDAVLELARIADEQFTAMGVPKAALAMWRPRFLGAAQAFIAIERERRPAIAQSFLERKGTRVFAAPGGNFTLSGRADRIDVLTDGSAAILDYKTGAIPSPKQVQELLSPQLPLEAAILSEGGFDDIGKRIAEALIYLSLADGRKAGKPVPVKDAAALAVDAAQRLALRIAEFDNPATPYLSRVRPFRTDSVGDYDHLARVREWSAAGGDEP